MIEPENLVTHPVPCPTCGALVAVSRGEGPFLARLDEARREHVMSCLPADLPTEFPDGRSAWVGQ
jgi:hypothetical protein